MVTDALTEALNNVCDLLCWRLRYRAFDLQGPADTWYGRRRAVQPKTTSRIARTRAPEPRSLGAEGRAFAGAEDFARLSGGR